VCRNIKPLYNLDPPATDDEIRHAALQFVRKISGYNKPSRVNESAFNEAVSEIAAITARMLESLETSAVPRDRERLARKARERVPQR
jgi:hypothetical protein